MRSGWLFFDADCAWCVALQRVFSPLLRFHGYCAVPLQTPGVAEWLGVTDNAIRSRMHILSVNGGRFAGADAFLEMARARAWSRPLAALGSHPLVLERLRRIYDWIAARRPCSSAACSLRKRPSQLIGIAPLLLLPTMAWVAATTFAWPAWALMWALAFSLFAACKWLTLQHARWNGLRLPRAAAFRFLFAWVGMEPREFLQRTSIHPAKTRTEWAGAAARTLLGAVLTWGVARFLVDTAPLAAGWVGMVGVVLLLHFGTFDLLACAWRRAGYNVTRLMNAPTRAHSVGNFWGMRWNRGFNVLARRFLHQPLASALGPAASVLGVFAVSGLIHDLVISVPAGGGYGLPTAYFLLQGAAILLERSRYGRWLKARMRGRLFALLIIAGPAFWLFPPVFVRNVILPMLHAIGAT